MVVDLPAPFGPRTARRTPSQLIRDSLLILIERQDLGEALPMSPHARGIKVEVHIACELHESRVESRFWLQILARGSRVRHRCASLAGGPTELVKPVEDHSDFTALRLVAGTHHHERAVAADVVVVV